MAQELKISEVELLNEPTSNTNLICEEQGQWKRLNIDNIITEELIRDDISSESTTYSSKKIDSLSSIPSNPNLLINGDFQIWQRGTEFNNKRDFVAGCTADMWNFYSNDGYDTYIIKKLEKGIEIYLEGKISHVPCLQYANYVPNDSNGKYVLSIKINDEIKTLHITDASAYSTCYYEDGSDFLYYDGVDRLLYIYLQEGTNTIEWVKLEKGTEATPFIPRTYSEELLACQRYYYTIPLYQMCYFDDMGNARIYNDWVTNHMAEFKNISSDSGKYQVFDSEGFQYFYPNGSPYYDSDYDRVIIIPLTAFESNTHLFVNQVALIMDESIGGHRTLVIEAQDC